MLDKFNARPRDIIFLVDNYRLQDNNLLFSNVISAIFDEHIKQDDKICLLKFGEEQFTRKVFSLVGK